MSKRFVVAALTVAAGFVSMARIASAQTFTVVNPSTHVQSKALRDLDHGNAPVHGMTSIRHHHGELPEEPETPPLEPGAPDPLLQLAPGALIAASAGTDFEGLGVNGFVPSDNNIAVGPNHIVETVNVRYAVYDRAGNLQTSGFLKSLWTGLGGSCSANNGGDPTVQYDRFANRWIITQLGSLTSPYFECIAVSTTGDPTGTYNLYSYAFNSQLNDYPKFGVWPTAANSAYLATYNLFTNGVLGAGAEICAYDRAAMLAGATASALCFTGLTTYSYLPSDVDGPTPPPNGTPGYFVDLLSTNSLGVYKVAPNFATRTATITPNSTTPATISVASFSQGGDISQPGTTTKLDSLNDRLMYRLAFRMFGDHAAMVVNHSVDSGGGVMAPRWYELRSPFPIGTFSVFQQGTFSVGDGNHRWMGSIAMDQNGDIGLGYSVSGPSQFPSIRYTGRMPGDPPGAMETEASIREGGGSQTGSDRWGDYSSMQIDPTDDCTFWYVNEYYPTTASSAWHTRIGSFKFNSCGTPPTPDFSLSANPASLTRAQGDAAQYVITINTINGFTGQVTLSLPNGCPTGASCSFSVNPVNAGSSSTLTITPTTSTPASTYDVTVQGDSGATHTTSVSLKVTDFSLSANPASFSRTQGQSGTSTITVNAINGFAGTTNLSVLSGCPNNATCSLSTNTVAAGGSSVLTVATTASTTPATYSVVVRGVSGAITHTTTVTVTVTQAAAADFSIGLSSSSLTVKRKGSGQVTVTLSTLSSSGPVTLSVTGLPSKLTASFTSNPVSVPGTSTLRISANPSAALGTFSVTVTGNNGTTTHSANLSITVTK